MYIPMNISMNAYMAPIMLPTGVIVYPGYTLSTMFRKSAAYPVYDEMSVVMKMHAAHSIPLASAKDFGFSSGIILFCFYYV